MSPHAAPATRNWRAALDLATHAAAAARQVLVERFSGDAGVRSQEGRDIKTEADLEAQRLIVGQLNASGLPILAEEGAAPDAGDAGPRWLVDPLDGTANFARGFGVSAVSIGLWEARRPVLGVVMEVERGTVYTGCVGEGAWRDGRPIHVSATAHASQAILATGFPTQRDYRPEALAAFIQRVRSFKKIRMIGSASVSLALVAEGVFDAYFEEEIMLWDVAAGLALVAAAGGRADVLQGRQAHAVVATATNGLVTVQAR